MKIAIILPAVAMIGLTMSPQGPEFAKQKQVRIVGKIELTPEEEALLKDINFHSGPRMNEDSDQNGVRVCSLFKALCKRGAIPASRINYFFEPEFKIGNTSGSFYDGFVRNGRRGDEVYRHPHFLKYFEYFVFGARLPKTAVRKFCKEVSEQWPITSEASLLGDYARNLTRESSLDPRRASEEFYKLSLDCGLDQNDAQTIRNRVK